MKLRFIALVATGLAPVWAQEVYQGPSILSRGTVGNVRAADDLLVFRPALQLLGLYESGIAPVSVNQLGQPVLADSYGVVAVGSLSGYHQWKRTLLGMTYQGYFRHYTQRRALDGTDQQLMLNVQHRVGRKATLALTGGGGSYSHGYAMPGLTGGSAALNYGNFSLGPDQTLANVPTQDIFDTRTYYAVGGGDLLYQKSLRLSTSFGGSAFAVRRRMKGLVELDGYSARGDVEYRLGRRSTAGIDYRIISFRFVRGFGSSDAHMAALNYAVQLDRHWTLSLRVGGYRLENLRAVRVTIDPAVAAILGQTQGVEAYYNVSYGPSVAAGLARNFRRAGINFRYTRDLSPGNGIFLTSRYDSGSASYSYRGWQRWALGLNASTYRYVTTFQTAMHYDTHYGTGSVSYRMFRFVHLTANGGARYYKMDQGYKRTSYIASVGLGFTPTEMPLSLW